MRLAEGKRRQMCWVSANTEVDVLITAECLHSEHPRPLQTPPAPTSPCFFSRLPSNFWNTTLPRKLSLICWKCSATHNLAFNFCHFYHLTHKQGLLKSRSRYILPCFCQDSLLDHEINLDVSSMFHCLCPQYTTVSVFVYRLKLQHEMINRYKSFIAATTHCGALWRNQTSSTPMSLRIFSPRPRYNQRRSLCRTPMRRKPKQRRYN